MYYPIVTLQQHFGDARDAAEVTVDLKRRMGIQHVGVGSSRIGVVGTFHTCEGELLTNKLVRVIAVVKPGPRIDLPAFGPPGASVSAQFE